MDLTKLESCLHSGCVDKTGSVKLRCQSCSHISHLPRPVQFMPYEMVTKSTCSLTPSIRFGSHVSLKSSAAAVPAYPSRPFHVPHSHVMQQPLQPLLLVRPSAACPAGPAKQQVLPAIVLLLPLPLCWAAAALHVQACCWQRGGSC